MNNNKTICLSFLKTNKFCLYTFHCHWFLRYRVWCTSRQTIAGLYVVYLSQPIYICMSITKGCDSNSKRLILNNYIDIYGYFDSRFHHLGKTCWICCYSVLDFPYRHSQNSSSIHTVLHNGSTNSFCCKFCHLHL